LIPIKFMIARTSHYVTTMLSILLLFIVIPELQAHDSPVFTLETITTTNSKITVSVSADDFTNISGGNIKLLYDCNVAVPTAVTKGPDLNGTCDYNLSEPGVIRIGWFAFPAENLPDGTVVFDIEFRKVAYGTSEIRFDNAFGNMDCQFYDGNH